MPFGVGKFVTVWKIEDKGKYSEVQISGSKKSKEGKYETDFSATARFIGHAHNKLSQIAIKSLIKIGDCEVTNRYDKEKKTTYTNYAVFDFEPYNSNATPSPIKTNNSEESENQEDLPF